MARLGHVKPKLAVAKPRLSKPETVRRSPGWYGTVRWQRLRERVFVRDNYTCRQTGALLIGKHPDPLSPVADHIVPHRGDPALFWDEENIQTVSKAWHDTEKQRQEKTGRSG